MSLNLNCNFYLHIQKTLETNVANYFEANLSPKAVIGRILNKLEL